MSGRHVPSGEAYVLVPVSKLRMSIRRKIIIGVTVVSSVLAVGIGTGTFASFSATTTNSGNVFSTGKLQLSNKVGAANACFSGYTGLGTSGNAQSNLNTNDNGSCSALFSMSLQRPGATQTANLTIENTGNYNGLLQFSMPGGCVDADVTTPAGNLNLCDKLQVYIQETNASFSATGITTCVFPVKPAAACDAGFGDASNTLSDLETYSSSTFVPSSAITLNQGASRYFKVGINFPDGGFSSGNGADNGYQNRSAAFGLTWRLQETA